MSIALGHMHHAYANLDGTYNFPNSREGDILKQAKREIEQLQAQVEKLERLCKTEFEELSDDDYSEWENVAGQAKVAELQAQSNYFEGEFCAQKRTTKELQSQINRYRTALLHISLTAQNSMSDKAECGRIARTAINGDKND